MVKGGKIVSGAMTLVLSGWLVAGCLSRASEKTQPPVKITADPETLRMINAVNKHWVDTAVSMLRQGYIVIRRGLGADSYMLAEMNRKDKTYSHCGIVMIENGYPFVYHSIGGEDNPDERLRRDSASFFFSPVHNTHIAVVKYDFDSSQVNRLKEVVTVYYAERPKFDMKFDLVSDDKLYCSEFVYKAILKAVADTGYLPSSLLVNKKIVGIDDLFMNTHAQLVWQIKFK